MPDQLFDHSAALNNITEFYEEYKPVRNEEICNVIIVRDANEQEKCSALEMILKLPKSVQTCFAALIHYLKDFKLEKILRLTRYAYLNVLFKLSTHISCVSERCFGNPSLSSNFHVQKEIVFLSPAATLFPRLPSTLVSVCMCNPL